MLALPKNMLTYVASTLTYTLTCMSSFMLSYKPTYKLTYYKFYAISNPNSRLEKNTINFQVHVKKMLAFIKS